MRDALQFTGSYNTYVQARRSNNTSGVGGALASLLMMRGL